ncbi:hypothetical protein ACJZL1_03555 [Wolbachia endosymbiont of Rhagoletis indifferens]
MLAESMLRDTANKSRYDGSWWDDGSRWHDVGLLSFQSGIQLLIENVV